MLCSSNPDCTVKQTVASLAETVKKLVETTEINRENDSRSRTETRKILDKKVDKVLELAERTHISIEGDGTLGNQGLSGMLVKHSKVIEYMVENVIPKHDRMEKQQDKNTESIKSLDKEITVVKRTATIFIIIGTFLATLYKTFWGN